MSNNRGDIYEESLRYHRREPAGKLSIQPTKPLATRRDLALAYSPGVASACEAIRDDPNEAANLTARGNLVAVITNGTAVLGLGAIGALASKPVMEGKAVLFKKFAHIDSVDIEIDEQDPQKLIDIIAPLEPSFGAINLEDIGAPACFIVEKELRRRMNIPVFHDDQHGTAIVAGAAVVNALKIVGKKIGDVKLVSTGGGAASLACLDLLVSLGLPKANITLVDLHGVVHEGRTEDMNPYKSRYARPDASALTLSDAMVDADIFLGLSAPKVLTQDHVKSMADKPFILALANPEPEILPELVQEVRDDAIMATGRSDYPNQVNNVLCFPFIFRGALDCGATTINEEMKIACVKAIAALAEKDVPEMVAKTYQGETLALGPSYVIPKPFDPRLILEIAPAVVRAAMESGVATRPIEDFEAYEERLSAYVFRSGNLMAPVFDKARDVQKRVVFAEGEDPRVLRAARDLIGEKLGRPILIGRPSVIARRLDELSINLDLDIAVDVINPERDERYTDYWQHYHSVMERRGVTPETARTVVRTNTTVIASLALDRGEADALVCGSYGRYDFHARHVMDVIGLKDGVSEPSALGVLMLQKGTFFICDAFITQDPTIEQLVETTLLAAEEVRKFGITPKVALLSQSDFGSDTNASACKMRDAVAAIKAADPTLEVEGEMSGEAATDPALREQLFPNSMLSGVANVLVLPTLEAANISYSLLKSLGDGLPIGPLLIGARKPAHIVSPTVTARGLLNTAALALIDEGERPDGLSTRS
ncbi:MAG: NADP-dependent malic enzyme [Pseudomonadota bacterium]